MARKELDLGRLARFGPKGGGQGDGAGADAPATTSSQAQAPGRDQGAAAAPGIDWDARAGFPSREPVDETSLTIRLPRVQAHRFRQMAKADRYTLGAFLEILMDAYEGRSKV